MSNRSNKTDLSIEIAAITLVVCLFGALCGIMTCAIQKAKQHAEVTK